MSQNYSGLYGKPPGMKRSYFITSLSYSIEIAETGLFYCALSVHVVKIHKF